MRATFIIKHGDVALAGEPAAGIAEALIRNCGNRILNHNQALTETWAFRDVVPQIAPSVIFAFRPTMSAIAICSRPSPTQFDVHLESSRADIWTVSTGVVERVSKALPPGRIKYEITLSEDDGKEAGIRGKNVTFVGLLLEQAQSNKVIPLLLTVGSGFIATYLFKRDALTGAISSAIGLAMLLFFIVVSCLYQSVRTKTAIKWKFEENLSP